MKVIIRHMVFLFCISSHLIGQPRGVQIVIETNNGEKIPLYHTSYALVIGVGEYSYGWPRLPNAVQDARDVASVLERQGFNVTLLTNPVKREITNALNDFTYTMGINPDNRLMLYFAGHGHTIKMAYGSPMGFIVPADTPLPDQNPVEFRRTAISMQDFESNARQIQAKHVLYVFDSCFSGSIFALSRAVPSVISYKTASPVRQFITAGDAGEEVPDKSIFKHQFIQALKGEGDMNRDGYITGTEMGEFLQTTVVNYSRESQHPQYGKIRDPNLDKGDYVFIVPQVKSTFCNSQFELIDYDNELNVVNIKVNQVDVKLGDIFLIKKKSQFSNVERTIFKTQVIKIQSGAAEARIIRKYYLVNPNDLSDYYAVKPVFGSLRVWTEPWCTVYLDGKKLGATPIIIEDIVAGEHEIEYKFSVAGYSNQQEKIVIGKNQAYKIVKNFNK